MARTVRRDSQKLGKIARAQIEEARRALKRGAHAIKNRAVEGIISPPKSGRVYSKGTKGRKGKRGWGTGSRTLIHRASAPGEFPAADTGELHTSITSADQSREGLIRYEVAANTPYAEALEFGTSKMEPRPFMGPSFDENIGAIRADIRNALRRGARRG